MTDVAIAWVVMAFGAVALAMVAACVVYRDDWKAQRQSESEWRKEVTLRLEALERERRD